MTLISADKPTNGSHARINDPERVKENILEAATIAFARGGLSGARVDEIAEQTHTSKRMIYYYFESKEGLYRAVLARCYADIRAREAIIDVDDLPPEEALAQIVRLKFAYHMEHPAFVRLVMVENIHQGDQVRHLDQPRDRGIFAIERLRNILKRGAAKGVFRDDLDAMDVHNSISALCFYNVSNRWTVAHLTGHDMGQAENAQLRVEAVVDMVLRYCRV
jgi:AcrR family transcriptional regulator